MDEDRGLWVILIKGLTPVPYKLVTIASGVAHFDFGIFVAALGCHPHGPASSWSPA